MSARTLKLADVAGEVAELPRVARWGEYVAPAIAALAAARYRYELATGITRSRAGWREKPVEAWDVPEAEQRGEGLNALGRFVANACSRLSRGFSAD